MAETWFFGELLLKCLRIHAKLDAFCTVQIYRAGTIYHHVYDRMLSREDANREVPQSNVGKVQATGQGTIELKP